MIIAEVERNLERIIKLAEASIHLLANCNDKQCDVIVTNWMVDIELLTEENKEYLGDKKQAEV